MTVIAYKGGVLASDSMVVHRTGNHEELKLFNCVKILDHRGWLLAVSGNLCPSDDLTKDWFFNSAASKQETARRAPLRRFSFDLLTVAPSGKLILWDQRGAGYLIGNPFYAIG